MGQVPLLVGAVAVEAEAQVVPDSSGPHGLQGLLRHLQGPAGPGRAGIAEKKQDLVGNRELGPFPEAAGLGIEPVPKLAVGLVEDLLRKILFGAVLSRVLQGLQDPAGGLEDVLPPRPPEMDDLRDEVHQARAAQAGFPGEVGGGKEGPPVRRQDDRQGPATGSGHHLAGRHVKMVQVGPLFPVHFDADEGIVQKGRRLLVLEGLMGHDVAPVAGGIADDRKTGRFSPPGPGEGLFTPGDTSPRDRCVLQEIGALFAGEAVLSGHKSILCIAVGTSSRKSGGGRATRSPAFASVPEEFRQGAQTVRRVGVQVKVEDPAAGLL